MQRIFHILGEGELAAALAAGEHRPASLVSEGFVHCSTAAQVVGSAGKHFAGRTDLLLLELDEGAFGPTLRYENTFPHIYAPLALDAVRRVAPLRSGHDGCFVFPGEGAWRPFSLRSQSP